MRHIVIVVVVAVLCGCASDGDPLPDGATGRVVHVVDGDTVDIRIGSHTERVRLIGIDTPETKKPNVPVQCFGPEATEHTRSLLPEGTPVVVLRDDEARDPYDRLLGYVVRHDDGLFVNRDIIANGYARPLAIEPNTTFASEFAALATSARQRRIGLWGAC